MRFLPVAALFLVLLCGVPALADQSSDAFRNLRNSLESEAPPPAVDNSYPDEDEEDEEENADYTDQWGVDQSAVRAFRKAHGNKKHARMVVYMNRRLTDRNREWESNSRYTMSDSLQGEVHNGTKKNTVDLNRRASLTREFRVSDGANARPHPEEAWMWQFEEGVIGTLLEAGSTLVDRSVIVRLKGADSVKASGESGISERVVEMDALKGYADILVEILVDRCLSKGCPHDYELKATAKSVKTGILLGHVTSSQWPQFKKRTSGEVMKTTDQGISFVNEEEVEFPTVIEAGQKLASELLRQLASKRI